MGSTFSRVGASLLILAAACGESATAPTPPTVATVTVTMPAAQLQVGMQAGATVSVRDAAGLPIVGESIEWRSSNATVATINVLGQVTAIAAGSTTISATAAGRTGSVLLYVVPPIPASVEVVFPLATFLQTGVTEPTTVVTYQAGVYHVPRLIIWGSSNEAVAAVGGGGRVHLMGPGTAVITAQVDGYTGSYLLTVPPVTRIDIVGDARSKVGHPTPFRIDGFTASNLKIALPATWSLDDPTAGTVNVLGQLTPSRTGSVTLRATVGGLTATRTVLAYDWMVTAANGDITAELPAHNPLPGDVVAPSLVMSCTAGALAVRVNAPWAGGAAVPVTIFSFPGVNPSTWIGGTNSITYPAPSNALLRAFLNSLATRPSVDFAYFDQPPWGRALHFVLAGTETRVQQLLGACP